MEKILVPANAKKKIKDEIGCSYPTIRTALSGIVTTETAMKIRNYALSEEIGGVLQKKN